MSLKQLDEALKEELASLQREGRAKPPERIITGYLPPTGLRGRRHRPGHGRLGAPRDGSRQALGGAG